jgi:TolB-like protein
VSRLKRLIQEIHRRSLWQVLGIYLGGAWVTLQGIEALVSVLGLPDWVPGFALVVLILGLPIVLATAFVQEGVGAQEVPDEGPPPSEVEGAGLHLVLTWRNLVLGGTAILALAGVGVAGWVLLGGDISRSPETIRSIAVLPLENLSGDPEQEYFADGMTEALIGDLAKLGSLSVISRTSVMHYKGRRKPLIEIARELNVDGIIEGTVMRAGDRVRITVQLIDARSDRHLWNDRYDRDLRDVLALQSEVARAVAEEIEIKLTPGEQDRLERFSKVDREAHELYLKARYEAAKFTAAGFEKAVGHYRQAIGKDPRHARAYAGLADAYILWAQPLMAFPHREAMPRAKIAARTALKIDDSLGEAHAALAAVEWLYDWDFPKADRDFRRAIDLSPSASQTHQWYGIYLSAMGRHEEAIEHTVRAEELDPLSLRVAAGKAELLYHARDYEGAIEQCQKILATHPDSARPHHILTWPYQQLGRYDEAIVAYQAEAGLSAEETESLRRSFATSGAPGYWRWRLARFQEAAPGGYVDPSMVAEFYGRLGEQDTMFEWLEKAYEARDGGLTFLKADPQWDPWRSDPRFQDLLRRIGFPEE